MVWIVYILHINDFFNRMLIVAVDNRSRMKRDTAQHKDFSAFKPTEEEDNYPRMSPQLTLATFQYLSTSTLSLLYLSWVLMDSGMLLFTGKI